MFPPLIYQVMCFQLITDVNRNVIPGVLKLTAKLSLCTMRPNRWVVHDVLKHRTVASSRSVLER